jgi:hypothetical protein
MRRRDLKQRCLHHQQTLSKIRNPKSAFRNRMVIIHGGQFDELGERVVDNSVLVGRILVQPVPAPLAGEPFGPEV